MNPDRLDELVDAHVDGALTPEERAELETLLKDSADARRAFWEGIHRHVMIGDLLEEARGRDLARESLPARRRPSKHRIRALAARKSNTAWIFAAAAAALVALAAVIATNRPSVPPPVAFEPAAEIPAEPKPPPEIPAPKTEPAPEPKVERAPAPPAPPEIVPAPRPEPPPPPTPEEPAPDRPAPPPPPATVPAVARLERAEGAVPLPGAAAAAAGRALLAGQGLRTAAGGLAVLRGADGTRLELAADTTLQSIDEGGRRVVLAAGTLAVETGRSTAGKPLVFATPHAEARVLGTRFTLTVSPEATRIEVRQGRVRFVRLSDGNETDVGRNQESTAAAAAPLAVRPLPPPSISFQDGAEPNPSYAGTRDLNLCEPDPRNALGEAGELKVYSSRLGGQSAPTLLYWDVTALPPGTQVVSAAVTLHVTKPLDDAPAEPCWWICEMRRPWVEAEATWAAPASGRKWQLLGARGALDRGNAILGAGSPGAAGPCAIPLNARGAALVQSWINRPPANFGLAVVDEKSRGGAHAASREAKTASQRPRLTVQYYPPER